MQFIAEIIRIKTILRSCPRLAEPNAIGHDIDLAEAEINSLLLDIYSEGYKDGSDTAIAALDKCLNK